MKTSTYLHSLASLVANQCQFRGKHEAKSRITAQWALPTIVFSRIMPGYDLQLTGRKIDQVSIIFNKSLLHSIVLYKIGAFIDAKLIKPCISDACSRRGN